jgi:anaerobic selenocysteine-containing dehydrogenase
MASESDGIPKTPEWAEARCGIPAETIHRLAIEFATTRTEESRASGEVDFRTPVPHDR